MTMKSLSIAATAALLAAASGMSTPSTAFQAPSLSETRSASPSQQPGTPQAPRPSNDASRYHGTPPWLRYTRERRAGPGWTNAHARRVATKKRRIKANKARR